MFEHRGVKFQVITTFPRYIILLKKKVTSSVIILPERSVFKGACGQSDRIFSYKLFNVYFIVETVIKIFPLDFQVFTSEKAAKKTFFNIFRLC